MRIIHGFFAGLVMAGILAIAPTAAFAHDGWRGGYYGYGHHYGYGHYGYGNYGYGGGYRGSYGRSYYYPSYGYYPYYCY